MKINQYETTDNLQNLKFLGANGSQTVGVPFETVKEHVFKDTNATPEKDGLMSKEDKAKLDGLGEYSVTGVKGNAEANYRKRGRGKQSRRHGGRTFAYGKRHDDQLSKHLLG